MSASLVPLQDDGDLHTRFYVFSFFTTHTVFYIIKGNLVHFSLDDTVPKELENDVSAYVLYFY